jgi:hypothetical protein
MSFAPWTRQKILYRPAVVIRFLKLPDVIGRDSKRTGPRADTVCGERPTKSQRTTSPRFTVTVGTPLDLT